MTIYELKPKFQALLRPLSNSLAKQQISANQVTLFALGLSLLFATLLFFFPNQKAILLCFPLILFIRMALNAIDGMLAREHNMKSPLGTILNEISDVLADSAMYLPFALITGLSPVAVILLVVLAIISEMTGVVAIQIGASRRYDGPMGKSDRAFLFGFIAVLVCLSTKPIIINTLLTIAIVLLCITIFNRAKQALLEIKDQTR